MSRLEPEPTWRDVTKTLNKFSKPQLIALPKDLDSIFDVTDPRFDQECKPEEKATKYDVVAGYVRHLKRNIDSWTAILHLNLLNAKYRSSRIVWKIFRGDRTKAQENAVGRSPDEIEGMLQEELRSTSRSKIAVQLHNDAYWIQVATKSKNARQSTAVSVIYIVHYTHTSCFASIAMSVKLKDIICKAMEAVFGLVNVALTALQDRNLDSLFQLHLYAKIPERFTERGVENPSLEEEPIHDYDPRILDMQAEEKAERNLAFKRKFGKEKAPPIRKLTYQLRTVFGGTRHVPQLRDIPSAALMETIVVFDGADVLNGIQQMVRTGMSTAQLPKHLTDVRTLGRTQFLIRPRASNAL